MKSARMTFTREFPVKKCCLFLRMEDALDLWKMLT